LVIGAPTTSTVISGMTYTSIGTVYVYDNSQSLTSYNLLETINAPDLQNNLRFGHEVVICPNTCSIYVGAIGYNSLSNSNGVVYRYINTGRLYGVIVGTNPSPVINIGDTLTINGVTVTFTGVTNTAAVKDINAANIPGVVASTFNNLNLELQPTVSIANNNIIIGSNSSAKN